MNPFIRCRTCFEQTDDELYASINNIYYLNKSVKEMITMLVPQMAKTLNDADLICKNCFEILKNCMIFIEKCLEVERKLEENRQILNHYSNEYKGAATLENANQPFLNIYADLGDNHIENRSTENVNMQENCITNVKNVCVNGQQLTCIRQGDSTSERDVQEIGGLVLLLPQFLRNDIPVEQLKTNCDVGLSLNLENKICTEADFNTNEDNLQKNNLAFQLDNSSLIIDHSSCTQAEMLNVRHHNRLVTLEQPNGNVIPDFITYLLLSEVDVLQISKNPGPSISSTKKRILLLGTTLNCPKCSKYFESNKLYNKHIVKCQIKRQKERKVRVPPARVCRLCNKKIEADQMKLHKKQHELEQRRERRQEKLNLWWCQICSERFTSKEDYELHLEFHPPHICDQCGKGFVRKISLQAHKNCHNAPNSFICEICGKGYKDRCSLRCHIQQHQDKTLKCDKCPKLFKTNHRLKQHVKIVHDKEDQVQCNLCGILLNKGNLALHIRMTHLKMKPFKCKICGRAFGRSDYMRNHEQTHGVVTLKPPRRMRIENNGKPLVCKFCGKRISNISNLKKHLRTHIKTSRYPCQFCSLTFVDEQLRRRHELIHQNVDGIVRCNICYKRFKTKEEMDEHITKHKNPQYACDTCGQLFHRKFLLDHHNSLEHMTAADLEKREEILRKSLLESVTAGS